ncbi:long-chain-fatty-acid--CoA ligase [Pyruvatibacter sp.]|uniref:long-chain-fatty-acid--CoA ligase n=1 Tax=Pyruvatibacter sp. TaxID=1981328 RepID=UPI0032634FA5
MIDFDNIKVIGDITRYQARTRPDHIAQIFEGRETTYGELDKRASQVGQGLIAEGMNKDGRIAFMGKGSDHYFEMLNGAFKAGSVVVGVNWRLAGPEVEYIFNDSHSEIVFVSEDFYDIVSAALPNCPKVRKVIALDGGHPEWESFTEWRDKFEATDPHVEMGPEDDIIQLYTSGTTGYPKGVQLTNANYISVLDQAERAGWAQWEPEDKNLVVMPLFHVAGVNVGVIGHAQGCTNIIMKDVDPAGILDAITEQRVSIAFMVPAVILFLTMMPNVNEVDYSCLRYILYGASPIQEDLLLNAQDIFKCNFIQVYGLTETTGGGTVLRPEDHDPARGKLRSCGQPSPGVEIQIIDEDGKEVPTGDVGEIIIKSGCIMKGYWNRQEATEGAIKNDWFYTGDAGYKDDEGFVYIHDRVKDMIVSGGENVYPAEVENALFKHPEIADVAVVGVPDEKWGEAVKAIVVPEQGKSPDPKEIINWAKTQIAGYKVPKTVDFIEALPRNPSGKILRRELRDPFWEGHDRKVG